MVYKKIIGGVVAAKVLRSLQKPPTIIPPSGFSVLDMEQKGLTGRKWKVWYIKDDQANLKRYFYVDKGVSGRISGSDRWKFVW